MGKSLVSCFFETQCSTIDKLTKVQQKYCMKWNRTLQNAVQTRTLSGTNNFLELSSIYHNSVTNNSKNAFLFSDYQ